MEPDKKPFPVEIMRETLPMVAAMSDGQISTDVRARIHRAIDAPPEPSALWALLVDLSRLPETEASRFVTTLFAVDRFYLPPGGPS